METRVSAKGHVVLPGPIRCKLGLRAGDPLDARVDHGHIVLTLRKTRRPKGRIVADPLTGLPVLSAGPGAPLLSSRQVQRILSNFP
jgi:AbrB family looped-hinge helix DNA binding protein